MAMAARCLGRIEGTFSRQVHGNVTQPSRCLICIKETFNQCNPPIKTCIGQNCFMDPFCCQWALKNIVFVRDNAQCFSDHVQIWPKQHIQWKISIHIVVIKFIKLVRHMCQCVYIQSAVRAKWWGSSWASSSSNSWFADSCCRTHWESHLSKLCKCLGWRTWVHCQRAGPSNGTVSATREDREWRNIL